MLTTIVNDLYAYTRWANARVLEAAGHLSREAFTRDLGSSFASIHATLVHMLGVEWIWLRRWHGDSPAGVPADWSLETVQDLRTRWAAVEAERGAFLETLDDGALGRPIAYRNLRGDRFEAPLVELLLHVVNHATYHRGQVITLLRQVGAPGVMTDLVLYHRETAPAGRTESAGNFPNHGGGA